jgi:hypothetical protein
MSKKNFTNFMTYAKAIKDVGVPAMALVLTLLNLYLGAKLNPVLSDIKTVVNRLEAVEKKSVEAELDRMELKKDIFDELRYLRNRIDTIYPMVR